MNGLDDTASVLRCVTPVAVKSIHGGRVPQASHQHPHELLARVPIGGNGPVVGFDNASIRISKQNDVIREAREIVVVAQQGPAFEFGPISLSIEVQLLPAPDMQ